MGPVSEHILDELSWRGLIAQSTDLDALRRDLDNGPLVVYTGFDPTAPSLHAGHLVQMLMLRRFQNAGHRPVLLAGGGTGLIGDPREVGERVLHSEEQVREWADRLRGQLDREGVEYHVVDIEQDPSAAGIVMDVNRGNRTVPTLVYADGSAHTNPPLKVVLGKLAELQTV